MHTQTLPLDRMTGWRSGRKVVSTAPLLTTIILSALAGCDASPDPTGPESPEAVWSVVVEPAFDSLLVGQARALSARAFTRKGSQVAGRPVLWSSSDTSLAVIDSAGVVTALKQGVVVLFARIDGRTGSGRVRVREATLEAPVGGLTLRPALTIGYVGTTTQIQAQVFDTAGQPLSGVPIVWSVTDNSVATVDETGLVRRLGSGETTIVATAGQVTANTVVNVRTGSSYHLVYDRGDPAIRWLNLSSGQPSEGLRHGAGTRSVDPSAHPDRAGVAYVIQQAGGSQIAIQDISGRTYRFLAGGDQPAWSPQGDRIAYRSSSSGRPGIWVIPADGMSAPIELTADLPAGFGGERPAWSPDGLQIVFSLSRPGEPSHLWLMNADGTGKRALTSSLEHDTEPSWYGESIVFVRKNGVGAGEVWRLDLPSGAQRQLSQVVWAETPAWSPDGRWVAFTGGDGTSSVGDVWVMRPDGSDVRPLSLRSDGTQGGGANPSWVTHR